MRVRVRFDPKCRFDIGERTPETRALVAQYVKGFADYLAAYAGEPPGSHSIGGRPPVYVWTDANWRISYRIEKGRRQVIASVVRVERRSGRHRL